MTRVLVTRPKADAVRTAARLRAAGHEPLVLPLTEIRPVTVAGASWEGFDAIALTSANAVRMAPAARLKRIVGLSCFVVGESTAAAARSAGFGAVTVADGEAESLAALVAAGTRTAARILYLCGKVRRAAFEQAVSASGRTVEMVETYDTVRYRPPVPDVLGVLGDRPLDAALVYSPLSGEALADLVDEPDLAPLFRETVFLCISARAAAAFRDRPMRVATRPDEDALFDLLGRES